MDAYFVGDEYLPVSSTLIAALVTSLVKPVTFVGQMQHLHYNKRNNIRPNIVQANTDAAWRGLYSHTPTLTN